MDESRRRLSRGRQGSCVQIIFCPTTLHLPPSSSSSSSPSVISGDNYNSSLASPHLEVTSIKRPQSPYYHYRAFPFTISSRIRAMEMKSARFSPFSIFLVNIKKKTLTMMMRNSILFSVIIFMHFKMMDSLNCLFRLCHQSGSFSRDMDGIVLLARQFRNYLRIVRTRGKSIRRREIQCIKREVNCSPSDEHYGEERYLTYLLNIDQVTTEEEEEESSYSVEA